MFKQGYFRLIIFCVLFIVFKVILYEYDIVFAICLISISLFLFKGNNKVFVSVLLYLFLIEFLMQPVPNTLDVFNALFVFMLFYIVVSSFRKPEGIIKDESIYIFIAILMIGTFYFYYSIIIKQIELGEAFRAIIPFTFILFFLIMYNLLKKKRLSFEQILFAIVFWGLLYSLNNISLFFINIIEGYSISRRITLLEENTLHPIPIALAVISFLIILDNKSYMSKTKKEWYTYFFVAFVGVLLTQTRSMLLAILISLLLIAIYHFFYKKQYSVILKLGMFSIVTLLVLTTLFHFSDLFSTLVNNFVSRVDSIEEGDGNVLARFDEYRAALYVIGESPFLGGGIGLSFSERHNVMVNYIHNFPLFIVANFGLFGGLILFLMYIYTTYISFKSRNNILILVYFGFLAINIYSLFFAVFKWFSFSIFFAMLLSMALYMKSEMKKNV